MKQLSRLFFASLFLFWAGPSSAWIDNWAYQGSRVSYRLDGVGPPVVQIHGIGAGASSEQTKYQIEDLVDAGYRVYSIDLPGWGRSVGPQRLFSGAYYSGLIAAFVEEVVAEPAAVVGHSLGATYAIAAAAARPDLIKALVLNAPVGAETFTTGPTNASIAHWFLFAYGDVGQFLYKLLGSWPSLAFFCRGSLYVDPGFCDLETLWDYRQFTRLPLSIYAPAAFLTGNLGLDVREAFASLTQPVLLVWGEANAFTSLSEADAFVNLNPAAALEVIGDAGAMVNDEKSDLFNDLLINELDAIMASP